MKSYHLLLFLLLPILFQSCDRYKRPHFPFSDVKGIHYTEVSRIFDNGLKLDKQGYQLSPVWKLYFIADDSVMVFSPKLKRYFGYHVYFDHDSIFNTVDAWLKVKKINKDSIVFQSQKVVNQIVVDNDEGSRVFLTFYSEQYIKNHNAESIRKKGLPGPKDTAFIRERVKLANANPDSAFSATQPVTLTSRSPLVNIEIIKPESTPMEKIDPAMDYLLPEFTVTIHKAYEDFSYYFSAYVDENGQIHFIRSIVPLSHEFAANYAKTIQAIIDGYLKRYVAVTAGSTLGFKHSSVIFLTVTGKAK
jgi:hypothetical protein